MAEFSGLTAVVAGGASGIGLAAARLLAQRGAAAAAARFPLTHPAVASVLIGARNAAEIRDALTLRSAAIPAALWDALAAMTSAPALASDGGPA